ncbi:MAG: hypothetical protein WAU02_03765 [Candidatus Saccharimonadales bacterium]
MIELNLLPDVKKEFIKAQRMRNRVVSGAIATSLIAGGAVAFLATTVYGAQMYMISSAENQIKDNHKKLSQKQEIDKYLAVQSQLAAIDQVSKERDDYSRLFDYLIQLNPAAPSNISLYDLLLNKADTTLTLNGSAGSFEAVNNFRSTLENAKVTYTLDGTDAEVTLFSKVEVLAPGMSTADGKVTVSFKANLVYAPEVFNEHITNIKLVVPQLVTSNSDQNAPKELFTEAPKQEAKNGSQ